MDEATLEALRRNSGLSLSKDGVFSFHGAEVPNPRVQALFHRGIAVRGDGEVTLEIGGRWAYVATEGVARFVSGLSVLAARVEARFLGATIRAVVPDAFGIAPDDRVYGWFDGEPVPAKLLRSAHHAVLAEVDAEGDAVVLGGRRVPLRALQAIPAPRSPRP